MTTPRPEDFKMIARVEYTDREVDWYCIDRIEAVDRLIYLIGRRSVQLLVPIAQVRFIRTFANTPENRKNFRAQVGIHNNIITLKETLKEILEVDN